MPRTFDNTRDFVEQVGRTLLHEGSEGYQIGARADVSEEGSGDYAGFFRAGLLKREHSILRLREPIQGERDSFDNTYILGRLVSMGQAIYDNSRQRLNPEVTERDLTLRFSSPEQVGSERVALSSPVAEVYFRQMLETVAAIEEAK
ncbi:MAG: hypothetical protein AABX11_07445 [Nanoarchaeota archaeon]